jgi:serine/threonine-protein kinase
MDDERVYLILELVSGRNLREALKEHGGRPPADTVLRWMRQAAEGVAEAHRIGVIHRDLKPENLLVTPADVLKVIDFGIAKLTGWGVKTSHEQRVGTALYMSPEQIQNKAPDARMDVYALGVITYEALAGVHPIVREPATVFQICALQLGHEPRPLAEVAPGLPPSLCAAVDRALVKDPDKRLPSVRAFAEALHEAVLGLGEDRRAALRNLVQAPQGRLAATQPMLAATGPVATGPAPSRPPAHLARTMPLTDSIAFGPTSPAYVANTAPITQTAPVQAPSPEPPPAPSRPVSARSRPRPRASAIVVVIAALLIGVGGGVWIAMRLLP